MPSIAYPKPHPIPVPAADECPAGCTLSQTIACYLRYERELRADLAAAERQIARLIDFGRWAS